MFLPFKPKQSLFLNKKNTFSIVNHPTDYQHFNMELVHALQPL